ncbi:MAG TPA: GrpB family protein [Solirubrobacterales bacterium]|nr:GrpB family protein [Solirubrobacterales bacterium]
MTEPADDPIRVVPYDPNWPAGFEEERAALEEAIGLWITGGIHHVGSTAVPGLGAKPIIDILVGVEDLESSRACFDPLKELDYLYAPYLSDEMHWFCKPHPSRRTHHLHLVPHESARFHDEIAFRDYLRSHPEPAAEYAKLKRDLATRFENDREAYTSAKANFIGLALARSPVPDSPEDRAQRS